MSSRRCAAKTCFNTQGCRPNLKFFNFPKDEELCYQWAVNCDREDLLDKPVEQLSKFLLCADHFEPHWFLNPKYKTIFIRNGQPVPTIFYNNLADFVPNSLKKSFGLKNTDHQSDEVLYHNTSNTENAVPSSILRDGAAADVLRSQLAVHDTPADADDYTVEIKIDLDSYVEDSSTIRGCHKICRLCAHLVYEYKLISIFPPDKTKCLASKINRLLPEKVLEGDGLPEHVCNSCVNKLNECDLMIQTFKAADRKLRSLFKMQTIISALPDDGADKDDVANPESFTFKAENSAIPTDVAEFLGVKDMSSQVSLLDRVYPRQRRDKVNVIKRPAHLTHIKSSAGDASTEHESVELLPEETKGVTIHVQEESCDSSNPSNADASTDHHRAVPVKAEGSWLASAEDSNGSTDAVDTSQDMKVYQCAVCKIEYNERHKLLIHEITEHIVEEKEQKLMPVLHKKYKREQTACSLCGQVFSGKKPLRRHIREKHIPAENICEFCDAYYQNKSQLEVHRRLHTNEKPFKCEMCNISFHFKKELQRHKRSIHVQVKSLTCSICSKTCPNRNAMWRHEKIHTDERNVLCYLCGKVLSNPQSMRVHMRTHSNDRPCSCPTCGKSFKDNTSVSKHMLMHSTSKNFACDICGRAFYSKALVKQHKLSHSGVKPHKCETCGAAYNRLGNLNQHKKKHAASSQPVEDLSHECVVCGKRMRSELTLKYHLAKHTGEKKPFDCEVCGKRFVAVDPYRVHMRIHTGERPYQCTTCGKTFRSSFTLKQHAALHRDECPYACPFCERKFKRLQSLIVHKRTHTGEKPHRCPLCGRAFAQKGDMLKHTKTHNRDRPVTANKVKEERVVMEIEHISELALSDSEITSEFLIDMPIVEVETEIDSGMQTEINAEMP